MAVNQQQLDYLGEMGIPVWVSRDLPIPEFSALTPTLGVPNFDEVIEPLTNVASKPELVKVPPQSIVSSSKGLQAADALIRDLQQAPNKQIAELAASLDEPARPEPVIITQNLEGTGWIELESAVSQCNACDLHDKRQHTVFGKGSLQADVMIVGDIPRLLDEQSQQPFSGEAGELLNSMLAHLELDPAAAYYANLLKCRPPLDNPPQSNQSASCLSYLKQQIKLLEPSIVILMGRSTAQQVLGKSEAMAQLRKKHHQVEGVRARFITTYHPEYLLAQPRLKVLAWQDLQFIKQALNSNG